MWTALHLAAVTAVLHFAQGRLAVQDWNHGGRLDAEHGYQVPKTLDNVPISGQRIQKQIEIPSVVTRNSTAKLRGQIPAISDRGHPGKVRSTAAEKPQDHGPIQKRSLHDDAPFSRTTPYRRRPLPVKLKLFYRNRTKLSGVIGRGSRTTADHRRDVDSPIPPSGYSTLWILPNTTDATPAPLDLSPPGANASNASALAAAGRAVSGAPILAILLVPLAALALVMFGAAAFVIIRTTVSEEVPLAEILKDMGLATLSFATLSPNTKQQQDEEQSPEIRDQGAPTPYPSPRTHSTPISGRASPSAELKSAPATDEDGWSTPSSDEFLWRTKPWKDAERHVYAEHQSIATPSANMAQMATSPPLDGAEQDGSRPWSPAMTISSSSGSRVPCMASEGNSPVSMAEFAADASFWAKLKERQDEPLAIARSTSDLNESLTAKIVHAPDSDHESNDVAEIHAVGPTQPAWGELSGSSTAFSQSPVPVQGAATQISVSVLPASKERASSSVGSEDTSKPCILGDQSNTANTPTSDDSFEWPSLPGTVTPPRWTDYYSLSETSTASSDGTVSYKAGYYTMDSTQSEAADSPSPSANSEVEGQKPPSHDGSPPVTPPRWTDYSLSETSTTASSDGTVAYEAGSDTNDFTQSEAEDSPSPSAHSEVEGQKPQSDDGSPHSG